MFVYKDEKTREGRTRCGEVIIVREALEPEGGLERGDVGSVICGEHRIDVRDNSLDICRTILGHVLTDRLEVSPMVTVKMHNNRKSGFPNFQMRMKLTR